MGAASLTIYSTVLHFHFAIQKTTKQLSSLLNTLMLNIPFAETSQDLRRRTGFTDLQSSAIVSEEELFDG